MTGAQALAWPDAPPAFPIQLDPERNGFIDQDGVPFLIVGDSPWSLMVGPDDEELLAYFADRRQRGFNTLLVEIVEVGAFGGPTDPYDAAPFAPLDAFDQPVEAYWQRIDRVVELAESHGFLLLLTPMYVGYQCGSEGWAPLMQSNSIATHEAYADFLAARYSNSANILWTHSGDVDPSICGLDGAVDAIANAMKAQTPGALHTGHCERGRSSLECFDKPWLDVNGVYAGCDDTAVESRDAYESGADIPHFYVEGHYENEGETTDKCLMNQLYAPMLGGLQGSVYGNRPVWLFDSGWQEALADDGATFVTWSARLMKSRPWADLVPDYASEYVIAGRGSIGSADYVSAAVTTDRRTLIAFSPSARTIEVDVSKLAGSELAAWYFDPVDGTTTNLGTLPPTGTMYFLLADNTVLVIDDAAAGYAAPGTDVYYVPEPRKVLTSWIVLATLGLLYRGRVRRSIHH